MTREQKPQFQTGLRQRNLVYAWEGEVTTLRTEIERLRAALTKIVDLVESEGDEPLDDAIAIARAALERKP
jgi:hypothetical protein